jgi:MFS family permease
MLTGTLLALLMAPAVALLALHAPAPMIATAQAIGGAGMGLFMAVWQTTLQQHVPEEALSRVSAWDWMGSFLLLPLGLIAAGPVADLIGISTTLWISVAWAVFSTLVVLLVPSVRNLRRLDLREEEPEEILARLPGEPAEAMHGS